MSEIPQAEDGDALDWQRLMADVQRQERERFAKMSPEQQAANRDEMDAMEALWRGDFATVKALMDKKRSEMDLD